MQARGVLAAGIYICLHGILYIYMQARGACSPRAARTRSSRRRRRAAARRTVYVHVYVHAGAGHVYVYTCMCMQARGSEADGVNYAGLDGRQLRARLKARIIYKGR